MPITFFNTQLLPKWLPMDEILLVFLLGYPKKAPPQYLSRQAGCE